MLIKHFIFTFLISSSLIAFAQEDISAIKAIRDKERAIESGKYAEFDTNFLSGEYTPSSMIDISSFNYGNPIYPGEYRVDIFVNDQLRGRNSIRLVESQLTHQTKLCMTADLIKQLGLDTKKITINDTFYDERECLTFEELRLKNSNYHLLLDELAVKFSIAQAYLKYEPKGYISPDLWENGVTALFTSYNFNYYDSHYTYSRETQYAYLNLKAGLNWQGWRFRHSGNYQWDSDQNTNYSVYETYLQHDIPELQGQLRIGDTFTTDSSFDNQAFRGIKIASDNRMLPISQRSYAPVINGYANTNAIVTVKQGNYEIYNGSVPAGPFVISDLSVTGQSGELLVTVKEADGRVREFTVPFLASTNLMRAGINQYEIFIGKLRQGNHVLDEKGGQFTWRRGINNYWTMNGGVVIGQSYQSAVLGSIFSTPIGTVGADIAYARSYLNSFDTLNGNRYHLYYNKNLSTTNTNVALSMFHYSRSGFYNWDTVALYNDPNVSSLSATNISRVRNQYQLSIYQRLPKEWGRFYVTANYKDYWKTDKTDRSYSAGYSNSIKGMSYSLSYNNNRYVNENIWRREFALTLSMPLDRLFGQSYLNSQYSKIKNGQEYANLSVSGNAGEFSQYSYNFSGTHNNNGNGWSANFGAKEPIAKLSASYSYQPTSQRFSVGASGGAVLHKGGITLTNELGETFAIVEAKNAQGARLTSGANNRINRDGYAVIPYLSPYQINTVGIDPSGLPLDIKFDKTRKQVIPSASSIIKVDFNAENGYSILLQLKQHDGIDVPVGATIIDINHDAQIGFVTQGGRAFIHSHDEEGSLLIKWKNEQCKVDYSLQNNKIEMLNNGIRLLKLECQ